MCKKPDFRLVDDNPVFQACDGGSSSSFTPSVGVHERWPFGCTHLRQQLAKQFSRELKAFLFFAIISFKHHHGLAKTSEAAVWQGVVDVHLLARRYGGKGGHPDRSSHRTGFMMILKISSDHPILMYLLACQKNENNARQTGTWVSWGCYVVPQKWTTSYDQHRWSLTKHNRRRGTWAWWSSSASTCSLCWTPTCTLIISPAQVAALSSSSSPWPNM